MATDSGGNALVEWYGENVADPVTADEAYGYWAFVVGTLLAAAGLLVFLVSTTAESGTDSFWLYRSLSFSLAAIGIPVIMYGFVVVMPLDDRATRVAFGGLAISLLSVVGFLWAYPSNWNVAEGDASTPIILAYSVGLAIQALTAVLYPSITSGKRARERPAEAVPETEATVDAEESKATFELYRDRSDEWRWRLRHDNGNVIADSGEGYSSKAKAKQGLESVRKNVPGALVEEVDSGNPRAEAADAADDADEETVVSMDEETVAAEPEAESAGTFEVYRDRAEKWRWRLRHRNGNVIADGGQGFTTRDGAEASTERIRSYAADADTLEYTPAAFEVFRDRGGKWRWRLRHRNGNVLADSGQGYSSRSAARNGIESVRDRVGEGVDPYEDAAGEYRWRLEASNGEIVADSGEGYASKQGAERGFERVREYAPEADTLEYDPAGFEVYRDRGGKWRWRLRHRNGNILADSGQGYSSRSKAKQGLESVRTNATDAAIDLEDEPEEAPPAFEPPESKGTIETYEDAAGEFRWRLRHDNGNLVADSGEGYATRAGLAAAVDGIRRIVGDADTLEHDPAGFEVYADAAGEYRWRLRHRNGNVLADSGEGYASRSGATEAVDRLRSGVERDPEVYEDAAGEFRWRLKAGNGEIVADSGEGYASKQGAERGFERVREYAPEADTLEYDPAGFEVYRDRAGEYRWRLRHRNGNVLADSGEGYASRQKATQGLESVRKNAPGADLSDATVES